MKKILFATTALVATAGVAAADVTISGAMAFGVIKNDRAAAVGGTAGTILASRTDLTFTGTTETDGGVALTATLAVDNLGANSTFGTATPYTGGAVTNPTFSASTGGLTFTWGDTDGALDARTTELHRIVGLRFELWGTAADNDDDGPIARLDYAMGDFAVSLSYAGLDKTTGIGVSYNADLGSATLNFGLAYESGKEDVAPFTANEDAWVVSVGSNFGPVAVRAIYADGTNANFTDSWGLSAQYAANGLTVGANYFKKGAVDSYTVFGTYDLGGGAQLFAQHGVRDAADNKVSSMGIRFNF